MKIVINGISVSGKFKPQQPLMMLEAFNVPDATPFTVTIEQRKKSRSNNQNQYYWAAVIPICKKCFKSIGYNLSTEQTHQALKERFLKEPIVMPNTEEVIAHIVVSTSELDTVGFEDYLQQIRDFALEYFGVTIELPNEQVQLFVE